MDDDLEKLESELGELDQEFEGLGLDMGTMGFGDDELSGLGVDLEEAGLEELGFEEFGSEDYSISTLLSEGDEGRADAAFIGFVFKKLALRIIGVLIRLLRRHPRLGRCASVIRYVRAAIAAARRGRWVTALRYGRRAYRAARRCINAIRR